MLPYSEFTLTTYVDWLIEANEKEFNLNERMYFLASYGFGQVEEVLELKQAHQSASHEQMALEAGDVVAYAVLIASLFLDRPQVVDRLLKCKSTFVYDETPVLEAFTSILKRHFRNDFNIESNVTEPGATKQQEFLSAVFCLVSFALSVSLHSIEDLAWLNYVKLNNRMAKHSLRTHP